jgi:hypothetical protein
MLVLLAASLVLALPASASASASDVIRDCADDGQLQGHYSRGELLRARDGLPADLDEYSDCRSVIAGAISGLGRHKGGSGGGGGANAALSPAEKARAAAEDAAALDRATHGGKPSVEVGGHVVKPGSNGLFHLASASNGLPTPLLLTLIAAGLLALGGALVALRRRVPALARVPLPRVSLPRVPRPRLRR